MVPELLTFAAAPVAPEWVTDTGFASVGEMMFQYDTVAYAFTASAHTDDPALANASAHMKIKEGRCIAVNSKRTGFRCGSTAMYANVHLCRQSIARAMVLVRTGCYRGLTFYACCQLLGRARPAPRAGVAGR